MQTDGAQGTLFSAVEKHKKPARFRGFGSNAGTPTSHRKFCGQLRCLRANLLSPNTHEAEVDVSKNVLLMNGGCTAGPLIGVETRL